ncbi:MAG: zinc ABC transporter substrate-binding protein [Methanobacterium sp.]|nr:zinc ABC transporter substrate-binding protein [Methanobacterium sp.]
METRRILIILLLLTATIIAVSFIYSASISKLDTNNDKIGVIVSIPPQAEFVEKIGGDKVKVTVMVPPGANPHTYEPLPDQLNDVSQAELYAEVGSGIEFENVWMDKISSANKKMVILNCSEGINFIPNTENEGDNEYDTHVWVSPQNAKIMVENIYRGLIQVDPANRDYYKANKDKYLKELEKADESIRKSLSGHKNNKIMVYHPAWGYFCRDYGLTQIAIEKNGKEPTPQGIASLINQAKKEKIKIIFISPQYSRKNADGIASEIGGQVITVDDLDKNYIENLNKVADSFNKALNN